MNYKNQICPVCKKLFCDDDDIVVCPVCGTPHHRTCYNEYGKCMNDELHSTGFVYKTVNQENTEENKTENEEKPVFNDETENEKRENERKIFEQITIDLGEENKDVFIDGKPVKHFDVAIGKNQRYFIPRFLIMDRTDKKVVYNFFAFLFPLAWTVHRKLYKFSAAVLAFYLVITCASVLPVIMNKDYMNATFDLYTQENTDGINNILAYSNGEDVKLTDAETAFIEAAENASIPQALSVTIQVACFAVRILLGLFATWLYKDSLIKKINLAYELNTDEESVLKYLKRKGGTSFVLITAVAAFVDLFTFMSF